MRKAKMLLAVLVAGVMAFSLAGCGSSNSEVSSTEKNTTADSGDEKTEETETASGKTLGVSWNFMINESATETKDFLDEYAAEQGIEIVHLVADGDSAQQISDVNDLISQGCDAIAVVPVDSAASTTMINAVHAADIPYINFNRPVGEGDVEPDVSFTPDSEMQAYDSTTACLDQMIAAGIKEIRIIDIIGALTDENAVNRDKGLKAAIEKYKADGNDIEIVAELECDWDNEWITSNLPASVSAQPQANMLFVPSDYCAGAVAAALETAGRWVTREEDGHMWIASQDVYIDGYMYMQDGYFDSNALLSNDLLAQSVIDGAMKLFAGESYGADWSVLVECPVFTPDTCNDPELVDLLSYKDDL